jgi:hypothetical protein
MSFKPKSNHTEENTGSKIDYNNVNSQVRGGSRPARISLIVDLGTQERDPYQEDFKDTAQQKADIKAGIAWSEEVEGKQIFFREQKPNDQIALFCDLTNDVVDYGEELGNQPYRLLINGSFMGDIKGITFGGCYSFDKNGTILKDKGFTFHSNSVLTKLANATKQTQIISGKGEDNMDVTQLLGKAFMATVKKDIREGSTYINYKGCSEVPMVPSDPTDPDSDEIALNVKEMQCEPRAITFDNVTPDDIKWLRGDVIKKIKAAINYKGSKMQKVLEASTSSGTEQEEVNEQEPKDENTKTRTKPPSKAKPKVVEEEENPFDDEDESLF